MPRRDTEVRKIQEKGVLGDVRLPNFVVDLRHRGLKNKEIEYREGIRIYRLNGNDEPMDCPYRLNYVIFTVRSRSRTGFK